MASDTAEPGLDLDLEDDVEMVLIPKCRGSRVSYHRIGEDGGAACGIRGENHKKRTKGFADKFYSACRRSKCYGGKTDE